MRNLFDLFSREMGETDLESILKNFYNSDNFKTVYDWKISKPHLHKCLDKNIITFKSLQRESVVSEVIISKNDDRTYDLTLFGGRGREISHISDLKVEGIVSSLNKFLSTQQSKSSKWVGEF